MNRMLRLRRTAQGAALGLFAALAATAVSPFAPPQPVTAQPAAGAANALPTELRYVPHDAALFLYVDATRVLSHEVTKSIRTADNKGPLGMLEGHVTKQFGMNLDALKSMVVFVPNVKNPQDIEKVGFVVTFARAFDKKALEAGLTALFPKGTKLSVSAPDDKTALILLNLGAEYAKPRAGDDEGPITDAIKAAASGKHALVAGVALAGLPDELRKDDVPGSIRAIQPVFASDSLVATVGLGQSLDLTVTVKAKRAAQAADAEKALANLTKLIGEELTKELPDLEKNAALKDAVKVLKAVVASAKGAKFEIDGTAARMRATFPLKGLPLTAAYVEAVKEGQQAAGVAQSANNLKQIALAMHNYEATHGMFPPAAVCDKKGKPQLSWRVLILPYIEHEALYKEFKLDEPWDGPTNKKLIAKMPKVYTIPGLSKPGDTDTYYRVFVGNGAGFDWLTGNKINAFTDGTSNTLMCATGATAVPWTKPDELEFDPETDPTKLFGLVVNGKAQVAMFDGSVRTVSKLPAKETLKALITRNGGEVVGDDF